MRDRHIEVTSGDGSLGCELFQPGETGQWPVVIVYMDAFGIRPELAGMARRLAAGGYLVALPNLYYRHGPFAPFDPALVAREGPERDRFKGMIASLSVAMVMRDTAAVIERLRTEPAASLERIGTLGYCMGGGFALAAAGTFPGQVAAAASFHGGSLATDKPDSPHLLAAAMRARLYVGVAGIDPSFSTEQQDRLDAALRSAGADYTIETYEGARHGFAVTGHLVYDPVASERHWDRVLRFFAETLSPAGSAGV